MALSVGGCENTGWPRLLSGTTEREMGRLLCQLASKRIKCYFYRRCPNETIHKDDTSRPHPTVIQLLVQKVPSDSAGRGTSSVWRETTRVDSVNSYVYWQAVGVFGMVFHCFPYRSERLRKGRWPARSPGPSRCHRNTVWWADQGSLASKKEGSRKHEYAGSLMCSWIQLKWWCKKKRITHCESIKLSRKNQKPADLILAARRG